MNSSGLKSSQNEALSDFQGWLSGIELLESAAKNAGDSHRERAQAEYKKSLARCVSELKDSEQCRDDPRFIKLCIKHADMTDDPCKTFSSLFLSEVGTKSVLFWAAWAWAAEQTGDCALAAQVFGVSLKSDAEPKEILRECLSQFCTRLAETIESGSSSEESSPTKYQSQCSTTSKQEDLFAMIYTPGVANKPRSSDSFIRKSAVISTHKRASFERTPSYGGADENDCYSNKENLSAQESRISNRRTPFSEIDMNSFSSKLNSTISSLKTSKRCSKTLETVLETTEISHHQRTPPTLGESSGDSETIHPNKRTRRRCSVTPIILNPFQYEHREMMSAQSQQLEKWMLSSKILVDLRKKKGSDGENLAWPKNISRSRVYQNYKLGKHRMVIRSQLGTGSFGAVYSCTMLDAKSKGMEFAVKVERPPQYLAWEAFLLDQISRKVNTAEGNCYSDLVILAAKGLYMYNNASAAVLPKGEHGTLHDLVTHKLFKNDGYLDEHVIIHYTIEMIRWTELLLLCDILHCDMKTDNWLLTRKKNHTQKGKQKTAFGIQHTISLIDFGRAIDLKMYKESVQFEGCCTAKSFECIEMREGRPWKYQVDTFGLCSCVHFMLFGTFMELLAVTDKENSSSSSDRPKFYMPKNAFKRYWQRSLWENFFRSLLNYHDSSPPLQLLRNLRANFEEYLYSSRPSVETLKIFLQKESECTRPRV